jgi:dTDP-4-dehydrorhamnose 3,5-epimerase
VQDFSITPTDIEGLWQVQTKVIPDERGSVMESFRESDYEKSGLPSLDSRAQVNATLTKKGAVRGIHAEETSKFIQVAQGKIFVAIVDLRKESPTAGQWKSFELERGQGLFVSRGLGNSFQSISDEPSIYIYHFEKEWQPGMAGVSCNPLDSELAIHWPIAEGEGMIISDKDRNNPSLKEVLGR